MKLIKEIKTKEGKVVFKRWRLLNFYFFYIDIHEFFSEDKIFDKDYFLHNHPRIFISKILEGGYVEFYKKNKRSKTDIISRREGQFHFIGIRCFHKIALLHNNYCKTLVLTTRKIKSWGYLDDRNKNNLKIISNEEYRNIKDQL